MRLAWVCAVKDLRRLRRDPAQVLVWIGIPAFVAAMMMFVFSGGEVTPKGLLLVADEDASLVSSMLSGAFSQGALGDMITVEKVTLAEGRRRIGRGQGSALLHIPKGFGDAALAGTPTQLRLVTNPSQNILPEIITETVSVLAEGAFYAQVVAGDQLRAIGRGRAPSDLQVANVAVGINRVVNSVSGYLDPRRIDFVTEVKETSGVDSSRLPAAFLRGMLLMAVFFLAMGLSTEVWKEKRQGALRRFVSTPAPVTAFVLGRVLAIAMLLAAVAVCGLLGGTFVLQTSPGRLVLAILFLTVSGVGLYLLFQVAVLYAPTERAAAILANLLMFPLAMVGGTFFPFEVMPAWMASIGRWTPNGWVVTQLGLVLEGRLAPANVALMFGGVILFIAVMFWLAAGRLRRSFAL